MPVNSRARPCFCRDVLSESINGSMAWSTQFGKDSTSGGPSEGNVQFDPGEAAQFRDPIFQAIYSVRCTIDVHAFEITVDRLQVTISAC